MPWEYGPMDFSAVLARTTSISEPADMGFSLRFIVAVCSMRRALVAHRPHQLHHQGVEPARLVDERLVSGLLEADERLPSETSIRRRLVDHPETWGRVGWRFSAPGLAGPPSPRAGDW